MALSDDQRAMLRLLAQREQGYDDLAALMGVSVEEVRAKVADALAELQAEGGPGTPSRPLPAEPAAAPKPPPAAKAEAAAPTPSTTEASAPAQRPKAPRPRLAKPSGSGRRMPSLPADRGARTALLAGVAVVAVLVVLIATGALGGGSSDDSSSAGGEAAATETSGEGTNASAAKGATEAVLDPVGGSGASGKALFGRIKNNLALQVEAEGLAPTAGNQAYTIWIAQSPQRMLPLAAATVGKDGKLATQFEVPSEVLVYLAKGTFDQLAITLTDTSSLKASLAKAAKAKESPAYTGLEVLRGTITGPIVGAALKKKE